MHALQLNEEQLTAYDDIRNTLHPDELGVHQLLGLPHAIQGDAMELECQLASNGLYCGSETGYEDPRAHVLRSSAVDWRLLMQFDSDDSVGTMWGDAGRLYFWVRNQDLAVRDFSKTWCILQCC